MNFPSLQKCRTSALLYKESFFRRPSGFAAKPRGAAALCAAKSSAASPPASSWRCSFLCRQFCCRRSPLCFSKVLKARGLPPDRVGPGFVRGAWLRWGLPCGGVARAPAGSLCLLRWLAAGAPAWSEFHRHCLLPAGVSTRPPLLLWWLLSARPVL